MPRRPQSPGQPRRRRPRLEPATTEVDLLDLPEGWGAERVGPMEQAVLDYLDRLVATVEAAGGTPVKDDRRIRQARWLALYCLTLNERDAAAFANIPADTVRAWRTEDPVFAAVRDEARVDVGRALEAEMYRRAVLGVEEPVWYKGEVVGHKRVYSDKLLEKMVTAHLPQYKPAGQAAEAEAHDAVAAKKAWLAQVAADPELRAALERAAEAS